LTVIERGLAWRCPAGGRPSGSKALG
jgi:hypothetical protein